LQTGKPQQYKRAGPARHFRFASARELELALAAVRRELSCLRSEYLELGLHASLLAAERNTALKNLKRTEDYLAVVQPGFKPVAWQIAARQPDSRAAATVASIGSEPAIQAGFAPGSRGKSGWRRAFDAVRQHAVPARHLQSELSAVRQELADLRNDYAGLAERAGRLARERDAVIEGLQRTASYCPTENQDNRPADSGCDAPATDLQARLQATQDRLQRLQVEKNDRAIARAERDGDLALLQAEQQQSLLEIERLRERIASAEQGLAAARDAKQALEARLTGLDQAFDQARTVGRQHTAALEQRIAALEQSLADTHRERQALEASLAEANSRHAALEQRRQQLSAQLEELRVRQEQYRSRIGDLDQQLASSTKQRTVLADEKRALLQQLECEKTRLDERNRQLAALQQHHEQLGDQFSGLKQSLSVADQHRAEAEREIESLTAALEALNAEFAAASSAGQERAEQLEQQLAELSAALAAAQQERQTLEVALQEAGAQRTDLELQRDQLASEREEQHARLTERELQLVELQAHKEQLRMEFTALAEQLAEVKRERALISDEKVLLAERLNSVLGEYSVTRQKDRERVADLELSLSGAAYRLELAEKRIRTLEPQVPGEAAPEEALLQRPSMTLKSEVKLPAGSRHRHFGWTKAAVGFVFLVGVLASGAKLWDVFYDETERLGLSTVGPRNKTSPAETSVAALEPAAEIASPADTLEQRWAEQQPDDLPAAGQSGVAETVADEEQEQDEKSVFSGSAGKRNTDDVPVRVYLMQPDASATGHSDACGKDGKNREPCQQADQNISGEAVIELPSGVKYSVIKNGTGRAPQPGDTVVISYRATLPDGGVLDSSRQQGGAEAFRLSDAIPGLQEALQRMEEGARWEVYVPSELAFKKPGPFGGRDVVFVVELKAVAGPHDSDKRIGARVP
jgi:FKBP-type peptidyl-prolyl cis-trans isomerase/predicted  nucleic acid-binding Zn-ribbon protein